MPISERIQKASFTKSMAGYTAREVDAFLGDLLPLVLEQEQLISALRAKLGAMEARTEEIAQQEKEAYRLLERAREEADRILLAAEEKARAVRAEAEQTAESKLQSTEQKAAELLAAAEKTARTSVAGAKKTAETILSTADQKGKAQLAEVAAFVETEREKARRLTAECTAFEARFRTLVTDTAHAIASLQTTAPQIPVSAPVPTAVKPTASASAPTASAPAPKKEEIPETRDFSFAGGKPVSAASAPEKTHRKLYETVNVTYENDDDFADVRKIMADAPARKVKNPTHFSE